MCQLNIRISTKLAKTEQIHSSSGAHQAPLLNDLLAQVAARLVPMLERNHCHPFCAVRVSLDDQIPGGAVSHDCTCYSEHYMRSKEVPSRTSVGTPFVISIKVFPRDRLELAA
jgi:hypothetical protein